MTNRGCAQQGLGCASFGIIRIGSVDGEALRTRSRPVDKDEPPVGRNGGHDLPTMSIIAYQLLGLAAAIGADPHHTIVAAGLCAIDQVLSIVSPNRPQNHVSTSRQF